MQRLVKVRTEILGFPAKRSSQVGAAYISDEQSVTGENGVRFC